MMGIDILVKLLFGNDLVGWLVVISWMILNNL